MTRGRISLRDIPISLFKLVFVAPSIAPDEDASRGEREWIIRLSLPAVDYSPLDIDTATPFVPPPEPASFSFKLIFRCLPRLNLSFRLFPSCRPIRLRTVYTSESRCRPSIRYRYSERRRYLSDIQAASRPLPEEEGSMAGRETATNISEGGTKSDRTRTRAERIARWKESGAEPVETDERRCRRARTVNERVGDSARGRGMRDRIVGAERARRFPARRAGGYLPAPRPRRCTVCAKNISG